MVIAAGCSFFFSLAESALFALGRFRARQMLEDDFANSKIVTLQELKNKGFWFQFAVRCARLMAPIQ